MQARVCRNSPGFPWLLLSDFLLRGLLRNFPFTCSLKRIFVEFLSLFQETMNWWPLVWLVYVSVSVVTKRQEDRNALFNRQKTL